MGERIRIIDTPPGQAPEWVRKQWVGLELTVADEPQDDEPRVQYGARGGASQNLGGYKIDAEVALGALAEKSLLAARWWEDHAPTAFLPSSMLVFRRDVCEVIPEPQKVDPQG